MKQHVDGQLESGHFGYDFRPSLVLSWIPKRFVRLAAHAERSCAGAISAASARCGHLGIEARRPLAVSGQAHSEMGSFNVNGIFHESAGRHRRRAFAAHAAISRAGKRTCDSY